MLFLSLAALGVVYGDIGTISLYPLRECFHGEHAIEASIANVYGVLSLVFWSLIIVITIKYLLIVMRADNDGEGGILALMALIKPTTSGKSFRSSAVIVLGLFGAALLYGDGVITPAISVLSAVEGLKRANPIFEPFIIPLTLLILIILFAVQYTGTKGFGKMFGPITLIWFFTIGLLRSVSILKTQDVLSAVNPMYAVIFFLITKFTGFIILGSGLLVVTGGEALYADMGHFGPVPIKIACVTIDLTSLMFNYS